MIEPLLAAPDPIVACGAILGVCAGLYLGMKGRSIDSHAPQAGAVVGGILGATAAYAVLSAIVVLLIVVGIPLSVWYFRRQLHDWGQTFAKAAGDHARHAFNRQSHSAKVNVLQEQHQDRLDAIYNADVPRNTLDKLVEQEMRRYDQELQDLNRTQ